MSSTYLNGLRRPDDEDKLPLSNYLSPLLKNKLMISRRNYIAEKASCEGMFLCAKVDDEDLPWDLTEKEW